MQKLMVLCLVLSGCAVETTVPENHEDWDSGVGVTEAALTRCALGVCNLPLRCSTTVTRASTVTATMGAPIGQGRTQDMLSPYSQLQTSFYASGAVGGNIATDYLRSTAGECYLLSFQTRGFCRNKYNSDMQYPVNTYSKHWWAPNDGLSITSTVGCPQYYNYITSVQDTTVYGTVALQ